MGPYVFDEIELLARVGWKPEDLNPLPQATNLLHGPLRGVRRTVVQHENDLFPRATCSRGQKIQQADGLFRDRVLPQSVRELKWPVRIAKGSGDPDSVVLAGRFDPQSLPSKPIGVGGDGQEIEPYSVSVPQFEIRSRA